MCSIVIAALIFLIKLALERVLLVLAPVPSFRRELRVGLSDVQLLVLLQEPRHGEPFAAGHAGPRLFAGVCALVDVEMGGQLVGFAAHVAAEGALVGVEANVDLEVSDLGEGLLADVAAVGPLARVDP